MNTKLCDYNLVFGNSSLFHYFAGDSDTIELLYNKFERAYNDNTLKPGEEYIPLLILKPDQNGETAVDKAIKEKRPKSFELLLTMLKPYTNFAISKMMFNSFPNILKQESELIY